MPPPNNEKSITKKTGALYQLKSFVGVDKEHPPRFCFVMDDKIHNETFWKDRFPVNHKTLPLMLIKFNMDLTPETAMATPPATGSTTTATVMATHVTTTTMAAVADQPGMAMADYNLARKQWREDRCITGSVFMIPDGRLIWMSDIDFKYFEEAGL